MSGMITRPELGDAPYCNNCGYNLTGLTESSKCPECGRPLIEVLTRNSQFPARGKRWRSRARLFGWPVIDIAVGPHGGQKRGVAKGIIAIGDVAIGGVALGGMSIGVVAVGGLAVGAFALGGFALAIVSAMGGCALGGLAAGGMAVGLFATGGQAIGYLAAGGNAIGVHTLDYRGFSSPEARRIFQNSWIMPGAGANVAAGMVWALLVRMVLTALIGGLITVTALGMAARDKWTREAEAK